MRTGERQWGRWSALGALAAAVTMAGCYEHTYHIGAGAPTGTVVYDQWRHHWIAGLISPGDEMALDDVCPSGNATIEQEMTFLNGLVSALTSGIYSPTTVRVKCATGRADLDIDPEAIEAFVSDPEFLEWVEAVTPELLDEATRAQQQLPDR